VEKSGSEASLNSRRHWLRWVEPWYLAYALLGAGVAGMIPILIPLLVNTSGNVAQVGLVMAGISFGGLAAPLWGSLADRFRLHRTLLVGGMLLASLGLVLFPFVKGSALWLLLALLQGFGSGGAATVANLFIVEVHPQAEWDERIGWLQTFYGGGQVAGLLLAGVFSQPGAIPTGMLISAGLLLAAGLIGLITTHTPSQPVSKKPVLLYPAKTGEWALGSPQRMFHHLTSEALAEFGHIARSSFGIFLVVWLLTFGGTAVIFSLYPVLMQSLFKVSPDISSSVFALAAALGLALYSPAGSWSERFGAQRVLLVGFFIRLAAILSILILGILQVPGLGWAALAGFCLVVLAWSLLSVSSTTLAASLSPAGEGIGLGFFNAASALAGVLGSLIGGWFAGRLGVVAALALAAGGILAGLILSFATGLLRQKGKK